MEKHLKTIVIAGVIIILIFVYLIIDMIMDKKNEQSTPVANPTEAVQNIEDYVISDSVALYPYTNVKLGENGSRISGIFAEIVYENDKIIGFSILDMENNIHELSVKDMHLIGLDYEVVDGKEQVTIAFRTGGIMRMIVGSYVYMYKDDSGMWSLDERVLLGGDIHKAIGNIVDFEFVPMFQQDGYIIASHIVLEDSSGKEINLYLSALEVQSIASSGEIIIYYDKNMEGSNPFFVREGDNFSMMVTLYDGSVYTFSKGSQIKMQKSSKKGYWELEKQIDKSRQSSYLQDIVFGHDDNNVNAIDYLVLALEDGSLVNMPILHTQASYGKPYGNYQRTYSYDGKGMVISQVDPEDEFKMEMFYDNDIIITLRLGSQVWISKNGEDIYMMDYQYTHIMHESEE